MKFELLCSFLLLLCSVKLSETAKILAIFPFPGPSQYLVVQPYLKTLASRGHEVTVINAFPQKTPIPNYRDINVPEVLQYVGDVFSFVNDIHSTFSEIMGFSWYYSTIAKDVLNNENVQKLLTSPEEQFDLLIIETLQMDVLFGIAEHFKTSIIGVSSYGTDPYIDSLVNNISPMAYTPLLTGSFTERMNFKERLINMWHHILMLWHREFIHKPLHDELYKEYFPKAQRSLEELRQNISLILLNQHFSLSFPRSYVTNMIEVGGFHIQHKAQNLSQDIEDFINSSEQDVIYFSMGSNIKSEHFPAPIRQILLETFASLPYKILWKFENPALMQNRPTNVFINKWFPQADILAYPRLKLFITHGGLLSLIESIYHGKPVLGIPVFYDQFVNMRRAQQDGFGLSISYKELNHTILRYNIKELMENPQYTEKAIIMSQRYRDQPIDPLDKAIYWTEYVLRHRGAGFLRSPAQYLNYWQRNSWDCIAVYLVALLAAVSFFVLIFVALIKCCCSLKNKAANKMKVN
ncbi:UDP-glucosyltransferase 2-like [Lucilia sericata]|uniref:UDP-glucosyltransferase 2-like n=1 Tax=Lucilia sericata TaxID=13632 RepID=UPI0018A7E8F8|nr:UDP-glucosyltransferase 2-like [Lucilia sericata]